MTYWQPTSYYNPYELYHYGIPGMHWGERRYQNPDGSLTAAGRARYNTLKENAAKGKADPGTIVNRSIGAAKKGGAIGAALGGAFNLAYGTAYAMSAGLDPVASIGIGVVNGLSGALSSGLKSAAVSALATAGLNAINNLSNNNGPDTEEYTRLASASKNG